MKNVVVLLAIVMFSSCLICGCQKNEASKSSTVTAPANGQVEEQANCPVTGGPVKKNIYTWYNGKKVYFCCEGCKQQFEQNPEKYTDKLPQFQK